MIDIHAHVLPLVDDGSESVNYSLEMLLEAERQGITDLILTPHYRRGYNKTQGELLAEFDAFCAQKEAAGISVNLYLGQEAYLDNGYKKELEEKKIFTLCGTKYLLCEFDFNFDHDIADTVYDLINLGYKPIVAHLERYSYADLSVAREIKGLGGFIQVNASSIMKKFTGKIRKKTFELLDDDLVDFVASDIHQKRKNYMKSAYTLVTKRYGKARADAIFSQNAQKIIKG